VLKTTVRISAIFLQQDAVETCYLDWSDFFSKMKQTAFIGDC